MISNQLSELNEIIKVCESLVERIKVNGTVRSKDDLYEKYKVLIDSFCRKYRIQDNASNCIRKIYDILKHYYWVRGYTVDQNEAQTILETVIQLKYELFPNLYEKIFISHREIDKEQVDALIDLLYAIGIPRPLQNGDKTIFCSSHPAAYIENGQMIDNEIIKHFHCEQNVFFILWYTDNYFESQACLNEMGAVWVMNKQYQEILMPGFERNKIGGLLPKEKISFYANNKFRLNTFKEQIEKMFSLQPVDTNAWEIARDKFIKTIEMQATEKNAILT